MVVDRCYSVIMVRAFGPRGTGYQVTASKHRFTTEQGDGMRVGARA